MRKRRNPILKTQGAEAEPWELGRPRRENCMNPWNGECANTDIVLYIIYKGKRLPICQACWEAISSKDIEWKYD